MYVTILCRAHLFTKGPTQIKRWGYFFFINFLKIFDNFKKYLQGTITLTSLFPHIKPDFQLFVRDELKTEVKCYLMLNDK